MTTYLYLHTKDAIQNDQIWDSSWIVDFNLQNSFSASYVAFDSATIPLTVPSITRFNNRIQIQENNGSHTFIVELAQKNYTVTELVTELGELLTDNSPNNITYTCTYNSQTQKINTDASVLNFRFGPATTCLKPLGLTEKVISERPYFTDQQGAFPVNLSGPSFLYLTSNLSTQNVSSTGQFNILAVIPVTESIGSVQHYQNSNNDYMSLPLSDIDSVQIRILTDEGTPYELSPNSDVLFVLKFRFNE